MGFRITTWNVNGIRNPFSYEPWRGNRTFESMFNILESDIVVFQETKIQRKDLRDDMVLVPGWDCYFSLPRIKKGYSGVAIYTRNATCAPIRAEEGITGILSPPNSEVPFRDLPEEQQIGGYPTLEQLARSKLSSEEDDTEGLGECPSMPEVLSDAATLDSEGRCVILEFQAFVLIGVYCPAYRDESRDSFRMDFLNALDARVRNLVSMGKRVFVTGDINISKSAIDSASAMEGIRKGTTTEEEFISGPSRKLFNSLLADGVVVGECAKGREKAVLHDICRSFHPGRTGMYTCWDTRLNTRPGNYGSRIDYVLCSLDMQEWVSESNIQEGLMGSDHCPVYAVFKDKVPCEPHGNEVYLHDIMNPPGLFKEGQRLEEYSSRLMLPSSGRLLPEFDVEKRRSIKDMFARKPQPPIGRSTSVGSASEKQEVVTKSNSAQASNLSESPHASPVGSMRKRPLSTSASTSSKRTKPQVPSAPASSGQKSLTGFFKPKPPSDSATHSPATPSGSNESSTMQSLPAMGNVTPSELSDKATLVKDTSSSSLAATTTDDPFSRAPTDISASDTVIDPIVSKEDWNKLFTKKPVPKCDSHQEPCISLTTKKPGMNRGRAFWICPRPLGPSGEKEKGTQWRCPTFIWASDWNGSAQTEP